jgi:hypothetical protein
VWNENDASAQVALLFRLAGFGIGRRFLYANF